MPLVIGNLKRLELLRSNPEFKNNLWVIVNAIQNGLKENGFNIGTTQSPVNPVILKNANYMPPDKPGFSIDLKPYVFNDYLFK